LQFANLKGAQATKEADSTPDGGRLHDIEVVALGGTESFFC